MGPQPGLVAEGFEACNRLGVMAPIVRIAGIQWKSELIRNGGAIIFIG